MIPGDMFNYVKKVLGPDGGPRTSRAPRTRRSKTAAEMASKENAVRQRYGLEVKKVEKNEDGKTLEKLKETFSTGLQTASDTVNKLTPGSSSGCSSMTTASIPTFQRTTSATTVWKSSSSTDTTSTRKSSIATPTANTPSTPSEATKSEESSNGSKPMAIMTGSKPPSGNNESGSESSKCKVCMKAFQDDEFFKVCSTCIMPVCEDCSISYYDENQATPAQEEADNWVCSICTRRRSTRDESLLASTNNYLRSKQGKPPVDKKHESFDVSSGLGGGLMVPQAASQARRHSTGNAAAMAALQAAEEAKKQQQGNKKKGSFDGGRIAIHTPQPQPHQPPPMGRPGSGRVVVRRPSDNSLNALQNKEPKVGGGGMGGRRCSVAVPRSRGPGDGSASCIPQDYLGGDLLGINKSTDERRSSFESACSDSAALGQIRDRFVDEETSRRFHSMERSSHHQQHPAAPSQAHEAIRIVVDHVDTSGGGGATPGMRKCRSRSSSIVPSREYQISIYCDAHSPYGFGLRVVGAEGGYARVLWICPGGPAEQAGIRVGDKILDWNNIPLSSVPLEHIPQMIEHCDMDAVKVTIRTGGSQDDGTDPNGMGGGNGGRRLPNLPSSTSPRPSISMSRPREVGYVQFGLNYDEPNLLVTLWAAENLHPVDNHDDVCLPKPYAIVRLCMYGRNRSFTTGVEESTPHPVWRTKHLFTDLERDELSASQLEISVWNYSNAVKHECLGKTTLNAPDLDLDGSLHWFPLYSSEGNGKPSENQSRGPPADMVQQGHPRTSQDLGQPTQDLTPPPGLLHIPLSVHDLRRRSSAFSEESHPITEPVYWVEPSSRSLPGSRRASRASILLRAGRSRSSSTSMPLERKGSGGNGPGGGGGGGLNPNAYFGAGGRFNMRRKSDCGGAPIVLPPDFGKMKRNHSLDKTNDLEEFSLRGASSPHDPMSFGGSYRQLPHPSSGRLYN